METMHRQLIGQIRISFWNIRITLNIEETIIIKIKLNRQSLKWKNGIINRGHNGTINKKQRQTKNRLSYLLRRMPGNCSPKSPGNACNTNRVIKKETEES